MGAGAPLQTRRWRPGPTNIRSRRGLFLSPWWLSTLLIIILRSIPSKCERTELNFTILFSCSYLFFSRWEVPIDGVMLDGQQLPASALPGSGSAISALIDTVIASLCTTSDRILMLTSIIGKQSGPGTGGCCRRHLEAGLTCVRC